MGHVKAFHLSDILSVVPGCFVSRNGVDGIYNLLGHMTEDTVHSHQLPLAADAMEPELVAQLPWLKDVTFPEPRLISSDECAAWVAGIAAVHGEWHDIESAPLAWGKHNPLTDLAEQVPAVQIIPIELSE